ncbi:MAG: hypothetical protein PVI30_00675 [Myxococcales bacterium]|jgi:hypothetical protein
MLRLVVGFMCVGACVLASAGCGSGEEGGTYASGTYAAMNEASVSLDCEQTVQCLAQRGLLMGIPDPVGNCMEYTGRVLNGDADKAREFESNLRRCQQFVVCDYFDCAVTDAVDTFAESQRDAIIYDCTQKVQCMVDSGQPVADFAGSVDACVNANLSVVAQFTNEQRVSFSNNLTACMGLASCDWANCFPSMW